VGYGSAADAAGWTVPDHVPADLVRPLDHWNGVDYLANPLGFWDDLRDATRVFWSPLHGGFWCLTRYEDIHEAFQRADLFSSMLTNIPGREVKLLPISLDPPEHTPYRQVLNKPFAPTRIGKLEQHIRDRCNELLDALAGKDECEFIAEFGKALPTQIFLEMLGLPPEELDRFLEWNHVILHVQGGEDGLARQRHANEELAAYLAELVAQRRDDPRDDLVGVLLTAHMDGAPLPEQDVLGFLHLLFMAGLDTVTSALGWCWQFLAEHPAHRQQILDDPSLIPAAVEELLRYHSFVEDSRTVTQDIDFAGVHMKAGDRIMLPTSTASRDEAQFADALVVDFHRQPNRHIAFAAGPHRCVGSHLARTELIIAMEEWHKRIPHYRIAAGKPMNAHGGGVIGLDELYLVLRRDDEIVDVDR
jgi:cytochrome P450